MPLSESLKLAQKKYREANKEKIAAYCRKASAKYYAKNKEMDKENAGVDGYVSKLNTPKIQETRHKYYQEHKEKFRQSNANRKAKAEQKFKEIFIAEKGEAAYEAYIKDIADKKAARENDPAVLYRRERYLREKAIRESGANREIIMETRKQTLMKLHDEKKYAENVAKFGVDIANAKLAKTKLDRERYQKKKAAALAAKAAEPLPDAETDVETP